MLSSALTQLGLKIYLALPVSDASRQKVRTFLFEHAEFFFKNHLAYKRWACLRDAPIHEHHRLCQRYGMARRIRMPKDAQWYKLALERANAPAPEGPIIDVIIPVYRGFDETMRAVFNTVSAPNKVATNIIVINDDSPEYELVKALNRYAGMGLFSLLHNESNEGFVRTVNRGMALHPDRDCILLNADCMVYGDYADRLLAVARSQPQVATVTPLSNNGELCSYPLAWRNNVWRNERKDAALDALAWQTNGVGSAAVPTGVGYCMYISRAALNAVGTFDAETFGRGYGEENDFCLRATAAGFTHLMAGGVFVRHVGGSSFQSEKNERVAKAMRILDRKYPHYHQSIRDWQKMDPARPMRIALDEARLGINHKPAMLMVLHSWGGGTEKHVRDMALWLEADGIEIYYMMPVEGECQTCQLGTIRGGKLNRAFTPNLRFHMDRDAEALQQQLQRWNVRHLHLHHLVGYDLRYYQFLPELARTMGLEYDITLHDYVTICPRIDLIDETDRYCGEPAPEVCNQCIAKNGSPVLRYLESIPRIEEWRSMHGAWLRAARRVFVPNGDVATRLSGYFPEVSFTVRPHPETFMIPAPALPHAPRTKRRIGLIGALYVLKGALVLKELQRDAIARNLPLEFYVFGHYALDDWEVYQLGNLVETGRYDEKDLPALVAAAQPDCALFLSVWPETFSYTLSQAWQLGLYPVVFDIGAPAERIRDCGWGELIPAADMNHPSAINDRLMALTIPPKPEQLAIWEKDRTYPQLLRDYYDLDETRFRQQASASIPHAKAS